MIQHQGFRSMLKVISRAGLPVNKYYTTIWLFFRLRPGYWQQRKLPDLGCIYFYSKGLGGDSWHRKGSLCVVLWNTSCVHRLRPTFLQENISCSCKNGGFN